MLTKSPQQGMKGPVMLDLRAPLKAFAIHPPWENDAKLLHRGLFRLIYTAEMMGTNKSFDLLRMAWKKTLTQILY